MKKLLYLSLAVAFLGGVCSESEGIGKFKKKTNQLGLARVASGVATKIDVKKAAEQGDISTAAYIDACIARGNSYINGGNWTPLKEAVERENLITRLLAYVDQNHPTKADQLLQQAGQNANFDFPVGQFGGGVLGGFIATHVNAIATEFSQNTIDGWQFGATLDEALNNLETYDFTRGANNVHRLILMGALYAVTRGYGIPDTDVNAQAATSDAELIGPEGVNMVAPWVYPAGSPTDAQKRRAAELYAKIAETLE